MKKIIYTLTALLLFTLSSCSNEEEFSVEYTQEEKGQLAFLSCVVDDWVMSEGIPDYLEHLHIFAVVHGDRLTGDYYFVKNSDGIEEIRFRMLYGEELVFFPGDSEKTVWNSKVDTVSLISQRTEMPHEYTIEITGSTTASLTVKNIYGAEIYLAISFNSFDAEDLDI